VTKDCVRLLMDARLSTDARTVALYVASLGAGEHEVPFSVLRRLLNQAGERRVRQAVQDAADVGWLSRREGGRGHHPAMAFTPAKAAELSDSPATAADLSTDSSAQAAELKPPSSSSSSSSSSTRGNAREGDEALAALRVLLGDQAVVLDKFDRSAAHGVGWPAAVWGFYRPPGAAGENDGGGTQWGSVLGRLGERTLAVGALALALDDYANKKHVFEARLFRGFVEKAALETKRRAASMDAPARASPGFGRGRKGPQDAQDYTPTESFEGFNG